MADEKKDKKDAAKESAKEEAKAAKAEKKTAPKGEKTKKDQLPPKMKAIITALNSDPVMLEQVRALVRIHKRSKKGPEKA